MSPEKLTDTYARLFAQHVKEISAKCPAKSVSSIHHLEDIGAEVEVIFRPAVKRAGMSIFLDKSGTMQLGTPPEGAVILHPDQVTQILTGRPVEPVPTFAPAACSAASLGLTKLKAAIWEAAPAPGARPVSQKSLFGLVKKLLPRSKNNSHFRTTVRFLVDHKYLEKHDDGLRQSDKPPRKPDKNGAKN